MPVSCDCNWASLFIDVILEYSDSLHKMHVGMITFNCFCFKNILYCKGKGKGVPIHAIMACGRMEVQLHLCLTSIQDGGERTASRCC